MYKSQSPYGAMDPEPTPTSLVPSHLATDVMLLVSDAALCVFVNVLVLLMEQRTKTTETPPPRAHQGEECYPRRRPPSLLLHFVSFIRDDVNLRPFAVPYFPLYIQFCLGIVTVSYRPSLIKCTISLHPLTHSPSIISLLPSLSVSNLHPPPIKLVDAQFHLQLRFFNLN